MSMEFGIKFGNGALSATSGLSPTFIHFVRMDNGTTLTPPGITQLIPGIGLYKFNYSPSFPIYFQIDGATTGLGDDRYITGTLDPSQMVDVALINQGSTLTAIGGSLSVMGGSLSVMGNSLSVLGGSLSVMGGSLSVMGDTLLGIGNTVSGIGNTVGAYGVDLSSILASIGSTASPFGDSATDPATLYGYLKRVQEFLEGDNTYTKASGVWQITDRTGATTIATKTLLETAAAVTKS